MPDGIGFKDGMKIEKEKVSKMTRGQKWQYFKDYYMKLTIVVILVLISAVSIIRSAIKNNREMLLGGEFINVTASQELYDKLDSEYFEYVQGNPKKQQTEIITDKILDTEGTSGDNTAYYTEMQIIAQIASKELDYMFMDNTAFENFISTEPYADLNEVLTADQIAEYGEYFVYTEDPETGEQEATGIRLNDTPLMEEYDLTLVCGEDVILTFMVNGGHQEQIPEILDYIFTIN